jgi:hypothetical protein
MNKYYGYCNVLSSGSSSNIEDLLFIKVYPNPSTGELWYNSNETAEIMIFSIDGRLLHREESQDSSGRQKIDYLFEKGLYIVLLKTETGLFREKVVVY